MNFSSRLRHINCRTHIHKENNGIVDEEFEFIKPEIDEIDNRIDNVFKVCWGKFFYTFENGCVYDNKFTNIKNNVEVNLTSTHG